MQEEDMRQSKEMTEEAYNVLVDALSQTVSWMTAFCKPPSTKPRQSVNSASKPITHADVVDYNFLRVAMKR